MVHTDVGVRCKSCAPPQRRVGVSRGSSVLLLGVGVIIALVALGAIGGAFSGGNDPYSDYLGDLPEFLALDVTVEQVVDPWVPEEADRAPSDAHRFVAIEVVVEGTGEDTDYGYTDPYYFKLTDAEGFAYPALYDGRKPSLSSIELDRGEKTRGWLTFEVAEGNDVASLTYVGEDVPLQ